MGHALPNHSLTFLFLQNSLAMVQIITGLFTVFFRESRAISHGSRLHPGLEEPRSRTLIQVHSQPRSCFWPTCFVRRTSNGLNDEDKNVTVCCNSSIYWASIHH